MPFLLLLCLMAVCCTKTWPLPPFGMGATGSIVFTGATVVALLLAGGIVARLALRRLERADTPREAIVHRYSTARTYLFFSALLGFALCLFGLGWGATAMELGAISWDGRWVLAPGGELLILAPFLIAQMGSWWFFYDADRAFQHKAADSQRSSQFWSRRSYVFFSMRRLILVFAPLFLLMAERAIERFYPAILQEAWMPFASLLVLPSFLILFPLLLPLLLGLKPLSRGPLPKRLEANAQRLRFRYARILLWDTRGAMANAMVVGVVRWIRYVVFTDLLLEELSEDEVDGVFGHEVGHAHHGHILYYAIFLILSLVLMGAMMQALKSARLEKADLVAKAAETPYELAQSANERVDLSPMQDSETPKNPAESSNDSPDLVTQVAIMGSYMFVVFGFISRRCERQADIFGCRSLSCTNQHCRGHDWTTVLAERGRGLCPTGVATFVRALRRVEEISGMTRTTPAWRGVGALGKLNWILRLLTDWLHTWQHSTIAKRVAFLESIAKEPAIERRFQARLWVLKWLIMLGLIGALIILGVWQGWEVLLAL